MPGTAIYTILSTAPNLTPIVGDRIYPTLALYNGMRPSVVYTVISRVPTDYKQGPSDIDYIRVQIDSFSASYDQCQTMATMVREVLDRYAHSTVSGVHLAGVSFLAGFDGWEDEAKLHRRTDDYQFRIRRDLTT